VLSIQTSGDIVAGGVILAGATEHDYFPLLEEWPSPRSIPTAGRPFYPAVGPSLTHPHGHGPRQGHDCTGKQDGANSSRLDVLAKPHPIDCDSDIAPAHSRRAVDRPRVAVRPFIRVPAVITEPWAPLRSQPDLTVKGEMSSHRKKQNLKSADSRVAMIPFDPFLALPLLK
jgi:hypothetical protein